MRMADIAADANRPDGVTFSRQIQATLSFSQKITICYKAFSAIPKKLAQLNKAEERKGEKKKKRCYRWKDDLRSRDLACSLWFVGGVHTPFADEICRRDGRSDEQSHLQDCEREAFCDSDRLSSLLCFFLVLVVKFSRVFCLMLQLPLPHEK